MFESVRNGESVKMQWDGWCAAVKVYNYSETRLLRTPREMKKSTKQSAIYRKCDVRHWESERYNRVYVLTRVRTNRVSLY